MSERGVWAKEHLKRLASLKAERTKASNRVRTVDAEIYRHQRALRVPVRRVRAEVAVLVRPGLASLAAILPRMREIAGLMAKLDIEDPRIPHWPEPDRVQLQGLLSFLSTWVAHGLYQSRLDRPVTRRMGKAKVRPKSGQSGASR